MKLAIQYCFIASLFLLKLEANSHIHYEKYGSAFFTSLRGDSVQFKTNTQERAIKLHDSITLDSEADIVTGNTGSVFFKLSNNISFGILENTQFKIQSFKQKAFDENNVQLEREPSRSYLQTFLNEGSIVVQSNRLSPLSIFEIHVPDRKLELHSAKSVIAYKHNLLHIALFEGHITLKTNDSLIHLNAPSYYVNARYDLTHSINNSSRKTSDIPPQWNLLKDYISVENDRVIFFPNDTDSHSAAKAKLIISEDFYNQDYTTPRSFKKTQSND